MATELIQGTKEYIIADVVDKTGGLNSLDGTNPRFTVQGPGVTTTFWYTDEPAQNVGMTAYALIDTSAAHSLGLWPAGEYKITFKFDTPAEVPRVYPGTFTVRIP